MVPQINLPALICATIIVVPMLFIVDLSHVIYYNWKKRYREKEYWEGSLYGTLTQLAFIALMYFILQF